MRDMADATMLIKYLVRNIAFAEGRSVTFMPKPLFGEAGSGMHVHMHLPGYEAPVSICFATANRSAVVRIPDYAKAPEQKRFEIRSPDATCNPYLAFSAILMAGMDGVVRKLDPVERGYGPYDVNLYNLPAEEQKKIKALPTTLDEALDALEADHEFLLAGGVFPKRLIEVWIERKRKEARQIAQLPHPAEFGAYYDL